MKDERFKSMASKYTISLGKRYEKQEGLMLFNSIKVIMKNPGEGRATSRLDQETLITKMIILPASDAAEMQL